MGPNVYLGGKQLNVNPTEETTTMRPRSPVGVQEWVASLPIPFKGSSQTSNIELLESKPTVSNAKIIVL